MNNKKETPVSLVVEEIKCRGLTTKELVKSFDHALEMEAKKQQKYDEMLAMLDVCKQATSSFDIHRDLEQLIKEAKEL